MCEMLALTVDLFAETTLRAPDKLKQSVFELVIDVSVQAVDTMIDHLMCLESPTCLLGHDLLFVYEKLIFACMTTSSLVVNDNIQ